MAEAMPVPETSYENILAGMQTNRLSRVRYIFGRTLKGVVGGWFLGNFVGFSVGAVVGTSAEFAAYADGLPVPPGSGVTVGQEVGGTVGGSLGALVGGTWGFLRGIYDDRGYKHWLEDRATDEKKWKENLASLRKRREEKRISRRQKR